MQAHRDSIMQNEYQEAYWSRRFSKEGHTGYEDKVIYLYDQPLRVRSVKGILKRLFPSGLKGKSAFDAGCGTGDFINLLLKLGAETVHSADISLKVTELTGNRFSSLGARVNVIAGAIQSMELPEKLFDVATCVTVLQHIIDDNEVVAVLGRLEKALKRDGFIIALEISPFRNSGHDEPGILRERSLAEWQAIISNAGLFLVMEPVVYSPLGFCAVQLWLPSFIKKFIGTHKIEPNAGMPITEIPEHSSFSFKRSIKRKSYNLLKRLILLITYPVDYLFVFKVPRNRAHYHIFVLQKKQTYNDVAAHI